MAPIRTRVDFLEEIGRLAVEIADADEEATTKRRRRDRLFLDAQRAGATRQEIADSAQVSLAAVKFVLGNSRTRARKKTRARRDARRNGQTP